MAHPGAPDGRFRGLTLSGTKTHVKQCFLPLTPLLMVADALWSPVLPVAEHNDMPVAQQYPHHSAFRPDSEDEQKLPVYKSCSTPGMEYY